MLLVTTPRADDVRAAYVTENIDFASRAADLPVLERRAEWTQYNRRLDVAAPLLDHVAARLWMRRWRAIDGG